MSFMRTMLSEKGLINEELSIEFQGINNIIPVQVVVTFIENSPKDTIKSVNKTLSKIDFVNGDVMDFIKYLANGMLRL